MHLQALPCAARMQLGTATRLPERADVLGFFVGRSKFPARIHVKVAQNVPGAELLARVTRRRRPKTRTGKLRSLKVSDAFKGFVLDQLEELGDVTPRAMFGGVGLYHRGVFFGILARDTLYLKVDDGNRAEYERAGMKAFKPYADRAGTMRYYAVPLEVLESPLDLAAWAQKAIAAAERQ